MRKTEAQEVVEQVREAFNAHEWEELAQWLSEDVLWMAPDLAEPLRGREEATRRLARFAQAIPDIRARVRNSFGSGEWVCEEWTNAGTVTGPFRNREGERVPPTNREVWLDECVVFRVVDREVREIHVYFDTRMLRAQMGLSP